jgi:deoxyribose-phosphate aldolase
MQQTDNYLLPAGKPIFEEQEILPIDKDATPEKIMPDFPELLGKSQGKLKREFYFYQVRELMQKVGLHVKEKKTLGEIEDCIKQATSLGVKDILVTPFYFSVLRGLKLRDRKSFKVGVAVDYPLGENALKGKLADVKEACKKGADYVFCSLPQNTSSLSCFGEERRKIGKCGKACKKPFGLIAQASTEETELIRIVKNTDSVKSKALVIHGTAKDVYALKEAVRTAVLYKGKRQVYVITDVQNAQDLVVLMDSKVDKVFTPHAHLIAKQFSDNAEIYS